MPNHWNPNEEKALLSLIQSYEGRIWASALTGWSASTTIPLCDWEGITCRIPASGDDGPSVVAEVSLPSQGLSGTIPTELGLLTGLEHLTLKNNILQGSIPKEIANLERLVTLDLTECFLTGTLPQRFESPHLTTLLLANNAISGRFFETDDAPHLRSIQEIRMENNLLTGTLHGASLTNVPHLETLSLSDNDLSGLIPGEELGSLPALQYLYLDSNRFIGPLPGQLAQMGKSRLLELWVQDNALSGTVPASYVRFDRLHDFFIDRNKLTGALPPDLCGPEINSDFFTNASPEAERNYCDSIACPAGSVAFEGVYPCEKCPGGEAARLKNRYLGQTGECSNYEQRDVLKIFRDSTTKAGAWSGVSDWDDDGKAVCDMTGIACDAHGNIVEISLKNRRLEGHIPDEIGFLSFLETLDLSDNMLMGWVPSDLQWTSMTRLDLSGNRIRGIVPPMLCMKEELNGNGEDNVFYCDRIACPEGTYNKYGFHHGADGETCQPCYDETPFIAQKACVNVQKPGGPHFFQRAKETGEKMGVSPGEGFGIALGVSFIFIILYCFAKHAPARSSLRKKYERGHNGEEERQNIAPRHHDEVYEYPDEEEDDGIASFRDAEPDHPGGNRDTSQVYKDFIISDDHEDEEKNNSMAAERGENALADYYDDDDNMSRATTTSRRSATELVSDHQGMALNKREKFKKAVSVRMSGDIGKKAREAASAVNVSARKMSRRKSNEALYDYHNGVGENDGGYDGSQYQKDVELVKNSSSTSRSTSMSPAIDRQKQLQPQDLLDVPMIT